MQFLSYTSQKLYWLCCRPRRSLTQVSDRNKPQAAAALHQVQLPFLPCSFILQRAKVIVNIQTPFCLTSAKNDAHAGCRHFPDRPCILWSSSSSLLATRYRQVRSQFSMPSFQTLEAGPSAICQIMPFWRCCRRLHSSAWRHCQVTSQLRRRVCSACFTTLTDPEIALSVTGSTCDAM